MRLEVTRFGTTFQNPVLLAAGTCGFGQELAEVLDLERLGGIVTKSVTLEPRWGNPAPRVAELDTGMANSIGLTNPGVKAVIAEKLPWIRQHLEKARVFVSVAGHNAEEYVRIVEALEPEEGFLGFELNLSCPNDARLNGLPFALDDEALARVVDGVRASTERPLLVKLAPNVPDIGRTASVAVAAGADGLVLVNTMPGLVLDPSTGAPALGASAGGISGPAIRAVGVHAVWSAALATSVPIVGVGGISTGEHAIQYLRAGAALVQVGTASFADPRAALRVLDEIRAHGRRHRISSVTELTGASLPGGARPRRPVPRTAAP